MAPTTASIPVDRMGSCPAILQTGLYMPLRKQASADVAIPAAIPEHQPLTDKQQWPTVDQVVGNTPMVRLQHLHLPINPGANNTILIKLEGSNPGGSAKDRPALAMLDAAEASGRLQPGGHVIECTTGKGRVGSLITACATQCCCISLPGLSITQPTT